MKKLISLFAAFALLLPSVSAYALASDASFGVKEEAELVISGSDITSGRGFLKNTVWLTGDELEAVAVSASGEMTYRLGLGDSFSESVVYSTYENHGEPIWQYRRVCGLDLFELAKALGIDTAKKMSISVTAPDGMSKTLPDAFGVETKRFSFGTDGVSSFEVHPILAMYESSSETSELGEGVLPDIPKLGSESEDRVHNIFGYGQTDVSEITNCFWVKDVNRLRYGSEETAVSFTDGNGRSVSASLSSLIMCGIWKAEFGTVSATGIPLGEALAAVKISDKTAIKAVSSGGESITVNNASDAFLAWEALDGGKAVANNTAIRLYTKSGKCLGDVVSLSAAEKTDDTDATRYPWASEALAYLAERGIYTEADPADGVTRGDFVLMLQNAFGFEAEGSTAFSDVPKDSRYYVAIRDAKAAGIAAGYDGRFFPDKTITRQEAMALLYRTISALGKDIGRADGDLSQFADASLIAGWARDSVKALAGAGIVCGKGNRMAPNDIVTGAETAMLIYRALNVIG